MPRYRAPGRKGGFDNIPLPAGYVLGIDTTAFAAAIGVLVKRIRLLIVVRIGESWQPQLARQMVAIDLLIGGSLAINIIFSDLPGETLESASRYARTVEAMTILRTRLNGEHLSRLGQVPALLFRRPVARGATGGGRRGNVYLMWPDTLEGARGIVGDLRARAAAKGRRL